MEALLWDFFLPCTHSIDPHHISEYVKKNKFLPELDTPSNSSYYRENFMKIETLVMIGGPDDGVITPWQSR